MQGFWILLLAVHIKYAWPVTSTKRIRHNLMHGEELSIMLPPGAVKLEFQSRSVKDVLWPSRSTNKRGKVIGKDNKRKFVIDSVTFDDMGNYTVDSQNQKIISSVTISPIKVDRSYVAGETCSIPLSGLEKNDATLYFISQDLNLTLVDNGSPVGNVHLDYMGRIQVTSTSIKVLNVNVSDVGNYILKDRLNRTALNMSVILHERHASKNSMWALLLLLGTIPLCACCCCKKKICKNTKEPTTTSRQINTSVAPPVSLNSTAPARPTPAYTPGYAENTVYPPTVPPQQTYNFYPAPSPAMPPNPPLNPIYPPVSGFSPAPTPQWHGAP